MKILTKNGFLIALSVLFVVSMTRVVSVQAEEIVVSDNGAGSTNAVNVSSSNTTNSQQSNTANITNNQTTTASTGDNTANNTTGSPTTVTTGDANTTTNTTTSSNANIVSGTCCQTAQTNAEVTNNGANTNNSITLNTSSASTVTQTNTAVVHTTITKNLSTGNNTANNNVGKVTIKTGNITATTNVINGPINVSYIALPLLTATDALANYKIAGNGANSINDIQQATNTTQTIAVVNCAEIINNLKENYLTGGNTANHNVGNVNIETGSINSIISVINYPINITGIDLNCHCQKPEKQKEQPNSPAGSVPSPSSTSSSSSPSSAGTGASTTENTGAILPVTGNNFFVLALFGNIMMLLLGAYLRLRSGRSPGTKN